jgi:LEA14-like dessication related protein
MNNLSTGDRVRFLNSDEEGVIKGFINKQIAIVEDHRGFNVPVLVSNCIKKTLLLLSATLLFGGCNVISRSYRAPVQAEYSYNSLDSIHLAGLSLGDASSIPVAKIASVATALAGGAYQQSIPFSMTLHIDVTNPNKSVARLDALEYALLINEMEFAEGATNASVSIGAGETQTVALTVNVDLRDIVSRYSQQRTVNELSAFLGITPNVTLVTVKLRPAFVVNGFPIQKPAAGIPLMFNFGGKSRN